MPVVPWVHTTTGYPPGGAAVSGWMSTPLTGTRSPDGVVDTYVTFQPVPWRSAANSIGSFDNTSPGAPFASTVVGR